MSEDLSGVEQLPQPDPRGVLALRNLPPQLQKDEDATAFADKERSNYRPRGFERQATKVEITLLRHLGFPAPDDGSLMTVVRFITHSVRNRRWPTLEGES